MDEYPRHQCELLVGLLHEDDAIGLLNKCQQLSLDLVTQLVCELHLRPRLVTLKQLLVTVRLEESV